MPNILFISENEDFVADVKDQIAHHAKDFNFIVVKISFNHVLNFSLYDSHLKAKYKLVGQFH